MLKDNYCPFIYKGIYIAREAEDQCKVAACCVNELGPLTSTVDFQNDTYLKKQREEFSAGLKPSSCNFCWSKDSKGLASRRFDNQHREYADPYAVELKSIHYNVPPICNAKCITCGAAFSSTWAAEDIKFGREVSTIPRTFSKIRTSEPEINLDYSQVNELYFNGGEPMLTPDVNIMLQKIKDQIGTLSNIKLMINTNSSIMPKKEDVALWNECKQIVLICSIEAVGEQFEYIRNPLSWSEVSYNVAHYDQLFDRKIGIMISPNIGIHNALEFPKLVKWYNLLQARTQNTVFTLNPHLTMGDYSLDKASRGIKQRILELIPNEAVYRKVRSFVDNSLDGDDIAWAKHFNWMDGRRNSSWVRTFPELANLWMLSKPNISATGWPRP